jgi:hypothetical protein
MEGRCETLDMLLYCCLQINWFKHGSALNAMAALFKKQRATA